MAIKISDGKMRLIGTIGVSTALTLWISLLALGIAAVISNAIIYKPIQSIDLAIGLSAVALLWVTLKLIRQYYQQKITWSIDFFY